MRLVQLVVIVAAVGLTVFLMVHRGNARAAAWSKLIFAAFLLLGIVALLWPDLVTRLANLVGVGRGTDLLLYGVVVLFGFTTVATYLRFIDMEYRYARLARSTALQQARLDNPPFRRENDNASTGEPGSGPQPPPA